MAASGTLFLRDLKQMLSFTNVQRPFVSTNILAFTSTVDTRLSVAG